MGNENRQAKAGVEASKEHSAGQKKIKFLFVLVHGTWAARKFWLKRFFAKLLRKDSANWTSENTEIRKYISKEICNDYQDYEYKVINPEWSSRNSEVDREAGGLAIAIATANELKSGNIKSGPNSAVYDKSTKVFFIAHSHGSEVCFRAAKILESGGAFIAGGKNIILKPDPRICGIVAFNSPNIISLKRDFVAKIKSNLNWLEHAFKVLAASYCIFIASFLYIQFEIKNAELGGNYETYIPLIVLAITMLVFGLRLTKIKSYCFKLLRLHSIRSHSQPSRDEELATNVPVLALNSSGDEAWTLLNILTSIAQIPFYLTHKISAVLILFLVLYSVEYDWNFLVFSDPNSFSEKLVLLTQCVDWGNDLASTESIGMLCLGATKSDEILFLNGLLFDLLSIDVIFESLFEYGVDHKLIFLSLYAAFIVVTAINTVLLLLAFSMFGYVVAYFVEVIALGMPINQWNFQFFTNRKCIGLVPLSARDVTFQDTGIGNSVLNHSAPYEDKRSLENVCIWLKKHM